MSIGTEERTQPRLGLYYAIMVGAFAASIGALVLLNWTAFVVIALVSTAAVITSAWRLGVVGPQIVVEEPPSPPFNWRQFARWAIAPVLISAVLLASSWLPDGWGERLNVVTMLSSFCTLAFCGFREILRALRGRPDECLKPRMIRLGIGSLILGLAGIVGYALVRGNTDSSFAIFLLLLGWMLSGWIAPVIQRLAPTPRAPSQPAVE